MPELKIDYKRIAAAITFYENRGYKYVNTDWAVWLPFVQETKPKGSPDGPEILNDKYLVASGEQSLLQYIKSFDRDSQDIYISRKLMTCTPCFRTLDDGVTKYHSPYFMKVELMHWRSDDPFELDQMTTNAYDFHASYVPQKWMSLYKTGDYSFDLQCNGVELGSYGMRDGSEFMSGNWLFGTGLAEPRLSQVIEYDTKGS